MIGFIAIYHPISIQCKGSCLVTTDEQGPVVGKEKGGNGHLLASLKTKLLANPES